MNWYDIEAMKARVAEQRDTIIELQAASRNRHVVILSDCVVSLIVKVALLNERDLMALRQDVDRWREGDQSDDLIDAVQVFIDKTIEELR